MFDRPYLTYSDFADIFRCTEHVARDRFEQIDFFFHTVGKPHLGVIKNSRTKLVTEEAINTYLEATGGIFFAERHWREDVLAVASRYQLD